MNENNLNNLENNNNVEPITNEPITNEPITEPIPNQNKPITENVNQSNQGNNPEVEPANEKSNLYWVIYIVAAIVVFVIIILLLKGCNGLKNKDKNKIVEANDWVTNVWNKCVDPVYWYTVKGTGVNSVDINIDSVLKDCDTYYNEYKARKDEITSLSDDYKDFKDTFAIISEKIEIIYPKIKANKPVALEKVDYESDMEEFYENQVKLYNLVKEKYYEG